MSFERPAIVCHMGRLIFDASNIGPVLTTTGKMSSIQNGYIKHRDRRWLRKVMVWVKNYRKFQKDSRSELSTRENSLYEMSQATGRTE